MAGLFGLGGSASGTDRGTELGAWGTLSDLSNFGKNKGEKAIGQASTYWSDILSGDPTKTAQAIAPQSKIIAGQAEQQRKTTSEFGNRSGGTNAANQMIDTNSAAAIQNLINSLIPQAASHLENIGGMELNLGAGTAATLGNQTERSREFDIQQENQTGAGISQLLKGGIGSIFEGLSGGGGFGDVLSSLAGFALA